MKKLLNISVIAALAISPLVANAADLTQAQMDKADIVTADANRMATTGYVKGAYTELGTAINTKQDKLLENQMKAVNSGITDAKVSGYDAVQDAVQDASTGLASKASTASVDALTTRVDALQAVSSDFAEKTGVETAIEGAMITATVPTLTTWGNDNSESSVTVDVASISATYPTTQQSQPSQPSQQAVSCSTSEFYQDGQCYSCGAGATSLGDQATSCTCQNNGTWSIDTNSTPIRGKCVGGTTE